LLEVEFYGLLLFGEEGVDFVVTRCDMRASHAQTELVADGLNEPLEVWC
jgi:hypothetical protein